MITDFRETNPNIARGLNRATTFLSLVSLIAPDRRRDWGVHRDALPSAAEDGHHRDAEEPRRALRPGDPDLSHPDGVARTMRGLAGVAVGAVVQRIFPEFIDRYFHMRPDNWFTPSSAVQGLLVGLLTTLLFTLPPLLNIRKVKPALILRRDMAEIRPRHGGSESSEARIPVMAGFGICVGLAGIAAWLVRWNVVGFGADRRVLYRWPAGQLAIAVRCGSAAFERGPGGW